MPFKSEKQRKYLHANEPAIAKRWEQKEKARQMRGFNKNPSQSKTGSGTVGS